MILYAQEITIEKQILKVMCLDHSDCEEDFECRRVSQANYSICVEKIANSMPQPNCDRLPNPFPRGWDGDW